MSPSQIYYANGCSACAVLTCCPNTPAFGIRYMMYPFRHMPAMRTCRCELQPTVADAGTVLYGVQRLILLRLCNTGQVSAR